MGECEKKALYQRPLDCYLRAYDLFFLWVSKVIFGLRRRSYTIKELGAMGQEYDVVELSSRFKKNYLKNKTVIRTILSTFRGDFLVSIFLLFSYEIIRMILESYEMKISCFFNDNSSSQMRRILYALVLHVLNVVVYGWYNLTIMKVAHKAKACLSYLVYDSIFQQRGSETINYLNALTTDTEIVLEGTSNIARVVVAPIVSLVYVRQLREKYKDGSFYTFLSIVVVVPIQYVLAFLYLKRRQILMALSDTRMSFVNDALASLKTIRLYVWNKSIIRHVSLLREKELSGLKKFLLMGGALYEPALWGKRILHIILLLKCHRVTHMDEHADLQAKSSSVMDEHADLQAKSSGVMDFLLEYPFFILSMLQSLLSMQRIDALLSFKDESRVQPQQTSLLATDGATPAREEHSENASPASASSLSIRNLFSGLRGAPNVVRIENLNMEVPQGAVLVIYGGLGSGKTTLVKTICGLQPPLDGSVVVNGRLSYCPQEPWLLTDSIRSNIVLYTEFDADRYGECVACSSLQSDFESFPNKDLTRVVRNGSTISGGQRMRIAIARALYMNSDIVVLDDVFSPLDKLVKSSIFNSVVLSRKGRTVVLCTSDSNAIRHSDLVIHLSKGKVVYAGASADYAKEVVREESSAKVSEHAAGIERTLDVTSEGSEAEKNWSEVEGDVQKEIIKNGVVMPKVQKLSYKQAFISMFKYVMLCVTPMTLLFVVALLLIYSITRNKILSRLKETAESLNREETSSLYKTILFILVPGVVIMLVNTILTTGSVKASRVLHARVVSRVVNGCSSTDGNTVGGILYALSQAIYYVDIVLPPILHELMYTIVYSITGIVNIKVIFLRSVEETTTTDNGLPITTKSMDMSIVCTLFFVMVIGLLLGYYFYLILLYLNAKERLRELRVELFDSLITLTTETCTGLDSIRIFFAENAMRLNAKQLIENQMVPTFLSEFSNIWFFMRIKIASKIANSLIILLSLQLKITNVELFDNISTLIASFQHIVTSLINIQECLQGLVTLFSYESHKKEREGQEPEKDWPREGRVELKDVQAKYGAQWILHGLSLKIAPRERIALIGRTGAGKSTFAQLFTGCLQVEGGVLVDDVELNTLNPIKVRKQLAIIPQEPHLMRQTLRFNLDPRGKEDDDRLWRVLEKTGLSAKVKELGGLDSLVERSRLSAGEAQLLCITRALLRRSKLFIFDELSASLDLETERRIQRLLMTEFGGSTVIAIVHKLSFINDFDKVVVMEAGRIIEVGVPSELEKRRDSEYYKLLNAST